MKYIFLILILISFSCNQSKRETIVIASNKLEIADFYRALNNIDSGIFYTITDSAMMVIEREVSFDSTSYCVINPSGNEYFEFAFNTAKKRTLYEHTSNNSNRFLILNNHIIPIVFPSDAFFTRIDLDTMEHYGAPLTPPRFILNIRGEIIKSYR